MKQHPDSFLEGASLGWHFPPYLPTFEFPGDYIDDFHALLASAKTSSRIDLGETFGGPIKGWLRRDDALKLYELGYFAETNILELGSFHGLSTCILARANQNAGSQKRIYSVDLSAKNSAETRRSLERAGLSTNVQIVVADAAAEVKNLAEKGESFGFAFIDHSHSFQPVYDVCQLLSMIVRPGGFCLFHDFNDRRNEDPAYPDYGVNRAIMDGLEPEEFEFYGIYGSAALFRRRS